MTTVPTADIRLSQDLEPVVEAGLNGVLGGEAWEPGMPGHLSFHERATRVAHRDTGRCSGDSVCEQTPTRVAQDESLHMLFHREHHDEVLMPVLGRLGVFERSGPGPDGERARDADGGDSGAWTTGRTWKK